MKLKTIKFKSIIALMFTAIGLSVMAAGSGTQGDPWNVGQTESDAVAAYTNGTELVVLGAGTVADLSDIPNGVKGGMTAITVTDPTVTGAGADAFAGFDSLALTLPDGWKGELPDEDGSWYGAKNVTLTAYPLSVKNVQFQQRYPWNGLVDITCDLTGAGTVKLGASALTNDAPLCAVKSLMGETSVDLDAAGGVANGVKLVWNAMPDLPENFNAQDVTIEVMADETALTGVQLWAGGPYFAACNVGATKPEEYGDLVKFGNTSQAVTDALGADWRVPTAEDFGGLTNANYCTASWTDNYDETGVSGCIVASKADPTKSIFLPAAGFNWPTGSSSFGTEGYYWSSTPNDEDINLAASIKFRVGYFYVTHTQARSYGMSVRAVRDAPSAKSSEGTVDLRNTVALAKGETTVSNVTWSATAWGALPETFTTVGYMNLTTGATGEFGSLSNIMGEGAKDVNLPKKDGDYQLTHSTGDLTSFVTFTVSGYPLGSEANPWDIGEGVTAYTNGTELVIGGKGTVADLSEIPSSVKGDIMSVTIADPTVTGAEADAFAGLDGIALTLPDGWKGELPDEDGNWYGAKNVTLTAYPLSVKNVQFQQRYPWNGLVDITCDLTGAGTVKLGASALSSGVTFIANPTITGETTIDLDAADGVANGVRMVWNAAADLPAGFKADGIQVNVAAETVPPAGQLWKNGPIFAACNVGANKPEEPGCYFWWGDTIGYAYDGSKWVSVDGMETVIKFSDAPANSSQEKDVSTLMSEGWIDAGGNLVADRDAATAHLGTSWRMPTRDEFDALTNTAYCTSVWTDNYNGTGVAGRIVTGATDGYTDRSIFLPASGRGYSANYDRPGTYGVYWSSTPQADSAIGAWYLNIDSATFKNEYGFYRSDGCTVRPVQDAPAAPEVSEVSAEGVLDLTAGDRVAADEEPLVVDPAWGDATSAKVMIDGEDAARTYASASIDIWETTALEPGRYALALAAGDDDEDAAFWKTGADWVVLDNSDITADLVFEAGKTYLVLGTNMVNGATLTVEDGAKFEYDQGAPAGFNAGFLEELPKRYEITGGVDPSDTSKLYQILEKIKGSMDNPWDIGEGVTAHTNGTELVIGGEGTIADISDIPSSVTGGITAITVADPTVTGAEADAFAGLDGIALTLPDGWQGELPDEDGNWYGATGITLTAMPLTVKNVTFQQRYPWNGLVDITCDLTGAGVVTLNVTALTNNAPLCAVKSLMGETTVDLDATGGVADGVKLVWDAKADLPANFTCDDVVIEVTAGRQKTDGDYMVIDLSADGNGRFAVSYEDMDVASAIEKYNTDEYKTGKLVLKKIPAGTAYPCEPRMIDDVTSAPIGGTMTPAKDYFIGLFETTAAQYDRVMGVEAPSDATTPKNYISYNMIRGGDDSPDIEPTDPVAAESFMGILAAKTGVAGFDLPTEIQWEIAARAGSTAEYGSYIGEDGGAVVGVYNSSAAPWGNTTNFMWFAKNNNPAGVKSVGLLRPNLWGLYDTAGNVYEFCLDVYNEDKTTWDDVETPEADGDSYKRALRGGYFAKAATVSRPSVRSSGYSDGDGINIGAGFRLCRTVATAGSSTSATATSISEAFAVDLREDVALAEGETTVSNVTWSATLWGELDEEFVTAIGWTNLTTGATGVFSNLAGVVGDAAEDVDLPKKDGDYRLTHSTGDLTSFVTFVVSGYPLGSEGNPWLVGAGEDPVSVTAVSNGTGTVFFNPARGVVTKAGLEEIANAMGDASFPAKLISEDGSATNDLVMVLGASGTVYDTIAEALAADEASYTLFEVNGYFVSYSGGEGALGSMATDTFIPSVPTNLTANAYAIVGYGFAGWSVNGTTKSYDDCAAGVDFAQPGETLSLTALWTQVETKVTTYDELTNLIAKVTRPVTITLDGDIEFPADGKVVVPTGRDVTFAGEGKFDVSAVNPSLFNGITVGTGLKSDDFSRFVTDEDVKAYYENGKVVLRGRGESEDFPWLLGDDVTAWATDGAILAKPARGEASVASLQSMTNALSGYVPAPGELKVVSEDGSATNDVVMLLGDDGKVYDTLAEVLAADPRPQTVRLYEVKLLQVSLAASANGGATVDVNDGEATFDIPSGTVTNIEVLAGSKVVVTPVPNDGFVTFDEPVVIDAIGAPESIVAFAFVPNPDAVLRWKFSKATGRYFAQVAITAKPGYADAMNDLAFLFSDREQDGNIYAQLWDLAQKSSVSDMLDDGGETYRSVSLDSSLFAGATADARIVFGLSDDSFASANLRVPSGDDALIGLYVRDRKSPVSGNVTAGEPENFLCYLSWTTDGTRYFLPIAEGAANGALAKAQALKATLTARNLSSAVSLGLPLGAAAENAIEVEITAFEVGAETASGRVAVSAGTATSTAFTNGATVTIFGTATLGGSWAKIANASVDLSSGRFTIPAAALEASGAKFFKAVVTPSSKQIVE